MAATLATDTQTIGNRVSFDGVLNVCKAKAWTSHDVVAKLRCLLRGVKVGHAGTLDPAATGVLPILLGRGTRIAEYLLDWDKEYRAVLRLGQTTDTEDATGTVLETRSVDGITESALSDVVMSFIGRVRQVPPMFSAVKVGGTPLYKTARAGRVVPRESREVTIHSLDILEFNQRDVLLNVVCSKGTYIRTLCADLGAALGVGGHLLSLVRVRVGPLTLDRAQYIEGIAGSIASGTLAESLSPLDAVLDFLPACVVGQEVARRTKHGVAVPLPAVLGWTPGKPATHGEKERAIRIHDEAGRLIALGRLSAKDYEAIVHTQEPRGIEIRVDKVLTSE